jgi:SAM-dependent methyltransferase
MELTAMSSITIKQKVKSLLNTLPGLLVTAFVTDDFLQGIRLRGGVINTDSGATHMNLSEAESLSYIEKVFAEYKKYGGIDKFFGRIAEIGPGDNAGVAMLMRRDGCTQVDLIDRYYSSRNPEQQSKIYNLIAQKYHLNHLRTTNSWDDQALPGINWKIGQAAEVYFQNCVQESGEVYDFIVSRAVLEHLYDPLDAIKQMIACLKPGGQMFHEIDFRDHGMFSPIRHELTFLEVPETIYPWMVRNSGRPNRILVYMYRNILESMKNSGLIDYSILVTHLVNVGDITPHQVFEEIPFEKQHQAIKFVEENRQKFATKFHHIDSEDLAVAGIFLVVTKKG